MANLPLDGIRMLDLSIWQQGTDATRMLDDMDPDVLDVVRAALGIELETDPDDPTD